MSWVFQYPGDDAPDEELDAWATKELRNFLYELELREMGVLHACYGLVYKVPLCHDGTDY